jgi:hypothetical protein
MPKLSLGIGINVFNKTLKGGGGATTLPLSTSTFTITNQVAGYANNGQYIKGFFGWDFDNSGNDGLVYTVRYGFYGAKWSLYWTDVDNFTMEISSNTAPATAIPLTGWTPTVTIVTP